MNKKCLGIMGPGHFPCLGGFLRFSSFKQLLFFFSSIINSRFLPPPHIIFFGFRYAGVICLLLGLATPVTAKSDLNHLRLQASSSTLLVKPVQSIHKPSDFFETFPRDFVDCAVDYGDYWTLPFRWNEAEWGTFWTVIGVTGALILVDHSIFFSVDPNDSKGINETLQPIHSIGQWQYPGLITPTIYLSSFILQDTKLERASRIAFKSLLFQSLINQGVKNLIYRYKLDDAYEFQLFPPVWELPSSGAFPSGHASNMWSVLTGFAIGYEDDPVIPTLCYGLATTGCILMVTRRDHWISDIFLGAALGYYTAHFVAEKERQRTDPNGHSLIFTPTSIGMQFPISWI